MMAACTAVNAFHGIRHHAPHRSPRIDRHRALRGVTTNRRTKPGKAAGAVKSVCRADDSPEEDVEEEEAAAQRWIRGAAAACASAVVALSGVGVGEASAYGVFEREDAVSISSRRTETASRQVQVQQAQSRGIPLMLGATESDDDSDVRLGYTEPPEVPGIGSAGGISSQRWARAAFQWSVIFAVAYRVRTDRGRGNAVTKKLGLDGVAGTALVGTKWQLTLDIGREPGTWMPPDWGISGRRIVAPVAVEFREGGVLQPIAVGAFLPMKFGEGTWKLDGDTLRFNLDISGLERGDITLPEGKLYFKTLAWANMLSTSRGKLLLLQNRFVIRKEWRMAGVFKAEPLDEVAEDATVTVPPMRVRERFTQ